jgi:hypothetical protein
MGVKADGKKYKFKTEFYGIPVVGQGDRIKSSVEKDKWTIVENQLLAANKGIFCSVFEEGEYRLVNNMNGSFTVMLSGTGQNWALMGILNGGLIHSNDPILWEGLRADTDYWLYAIYREGMFQNPKYFERSARQIRMSEDARRFLLLAKLNKDGTIDTNPPGKVYSRDVATHVNDSDNPHGETLNQKEIVTRTVKHQVLDQYGQTVDRTIFNGVDGVLDRVARRGVVSIDTETIGPAGTKVLIPGAVRILHAHAQERVVVGVPLTFNLGQVVAAHTMDGLEPNGVMVYNSGSSGVPIRVTVVADFATEQ